jgi:hypothetical protein
MFEIHDSMSKNKINLFGNFFCHDPEVFVSNIYDPTVFPALMI